MSKFQQQIYMNFPVRDLEKSKMFFSKLGFEFNPQFTDENGACMIVGENIFVMLLTHPFYATFTNRKIIDAKNQTGGSICINRESKAAVDAMVKKAVELGCEAQSPKDHGFMYQNGFYDLDGFSWELVWLDPNAKI